VVIVLQGLEARSAQDHAEYAIDEARRLGGVEGRDFLLDLGEVQHLAGRSNHPHCAGLANERQVGWRVDDPERAAGELDSQRVDVLDDQPGRVPAQAGQGFVVDVGGALHESQ